ncbi:MAG: elongation factor P--(R)-beta-lysine ligase [Aureliella sp.]
MQPSTWQPAASQEAIRARSEITWRIRSFFHDAGFLEVHTPALSQDTVVDRYIEPISIDAAAIGTTQPCGTLYLQTSPEFCMKRMVASGLSAIYQICPAFRAEESGDEHNPEFTMLEWYRVGDDQQAGVDLLGELISTAAGCGKPEQTTYRDAFQSHTGLDPIEASLDHLSNAAKELTGVTKDWTHCRDGWLNLLFSQVVQPQLGLATPTVVTNYPASQSALARLSDSDPHTAERFELFWHGVELANGYNELTDASELARRNETVNMQRVADGHAALPADSRLLSAMQSGLQSCSGCALGLDRLVMAILGHRKLSSVMAFPIDRA